MKKMLLMVFIISIIGVSVVLANARELESIGLTEEELSWVEMNPVIRVAPVKDYGPIEFIKNGEFYGLSVDYLKWITATFGLEFEFVYYDTWPEILDGMKNGDIHLQTAMVITPERLTYASFTDSYIGVPNIALVKKGSSESEIKTIEGGNLKVGVVKEYAVQAYLIENYDIPNLIGFTDIKKALTELAVGELDVMIMDLGQASYYIQELALTNVAISEYIEIDYDYQYSFASPQKDKILTSILNKILRAMPNDTKQTIFDRWIEFGEYMNVSNETIGFFRVIAFITVSILVIFMLWSLSLKRVVGQKTRELWQLNDELEKRVAQRTIHLKEANERIVESEKLNALSRLVIGVAHEVNTPLGNSIMMTSYLDNIIKNDLQQALPSSNLIPKLLEGTSIVAENLNTIVKVIEDFRNVSTYRYENSFRIFDLSNEIESILNIIGVDDKYRDLNINNKVEALVNIKGSPVCFYHILLVLIDNVAAHGYKVGEHGEVDIRLDQEGESITLIVQDNGIGIEGEHLPNIFEPFYTSKRGSNNVGLGLYSVYNIVTGILKGTIDVETKNELGTKITIKFNANIEKK